MFYDIVIYGNVVFYIVVSLKGVVALHTDKAIISKYHAVYNKSIVEPYIKELTLYFHQQLKNFSLPIDLQVGTDFQRTVWCALQKLSYGECVSYTCIAQQIGKSKAIRAVANAIRQNPILIIIPCHRVIGKNGQLVGYSGGIQLKATLLRLENRTYHK